MTVTMHFLFLNFLIVLLVNSGSSDICQCQCCRLSSIFSCSVASVANVTVLSCSNCDSSVCDSIYNLTCGTTNVITSTTCTQGIYVIVGTTTNSSFTPITTSTSHANSDGNTLFQSVNMAYIMIFISLIIRMIID